MSGTDKFWGGLLIGTAVGVATGLLIAPVSGNQARRTIARKSRVYSQQAVDAVRQYVESLRRRPGHSALADNADEILNSLDNPHGGGFSGI